MDDPASTRSGEPVDDTELEQLVVDCLAAPDPRAELERRTAGRADVFATALAVMQQVGRLEQLEPLRGVDPRDPIAEERASWPAVPGVELEALIGSGGQGFVFRARQSYLDRTVAVKVLAAQWRTPAFLARFRREARLLAGLQHAHIVACHHAGVTESGDCHLVMEFVDGPDLRSWIERRGPMRVADTLRMGRDLASALAHALERGLIHRDVKPENVLLQPSAPAAGDPFPFVPKLVDLGLARPLPSADPAATLTAVGTILGTPATMAPEQLDDPEHVDHRADIYGLGCVLHHALTGQPAFHGTALSQLVLQKAARRGDATEQSMPGVPAPVAALLARMLAHDREQRPADYPALIAEFDALLASPRRPRRAPRAALVLTSAVAAITATWWATRDASPAGTPTPALAVANPEPVEGSELVMRAALDGATASAWSWRQLAGPPIERCVVDGPLWRGTVPHGTAFAELAFEVAATADTGLVARRVDARVVPVPAAAPLAPGAVIALFAPSDGGENVMARWRCREPDAWGEDESGRGVCTDAGDGLVTATLVLPRDGFELRGRIDPRDHYESPSAPLVPIVSAGLRLRFAGGVAAALIVEPTGAGFRASFARQRETDDTWQTVGEPFVCEGRWNVDDPLCFSLRWSGNAFDGRVGAVSDPDAMTFRVEPGAQWGVPWRPGTLEVHVHRGVAVFTEWELAALR